MLSFLGDDVKYVIQVAADEFARSHRGAGRPLCRPPYRSNLPEVVEFDVAGGQGCFLGSHSLPVDIIVIGKDVGG